MAENGALSTRKSRAVAALPATRTVGEAATIAGVGERTLTRWLAEDPHFQAALQAAEGPAIDAATRDLYGWPDGF